MGDFNPNEHLINLGSQAKPSMYMEVKWRLVWFREQCPEGQIETKIVHLDLDRDVEDKKKVWSKSKNGWEEVTNYGKGIAIFHAVVHDGKGGKGEGTKSENAAAFPDFIEKAESGSIGRALAALGYGAQFAPELNEAQRIVDAPIERPQGQRQGQQNQQQGQRQAQGQQQAQGPRQGQQTNNGVNMPQANNTAQPAGNAQESTTRQKAADMYQRLGQAKLLEGSTATEYHASFYALASQECKRPLTNLNQFTEDDIKALENYIATHTQTQKASA